MELKLPFQLKIKYLLTRDDHFEGKAEFHDKEYRINIQGQNEEKFLKIPFNVIGITEEEMLVRISGPSGVYVQDHMII